MGTALFSISDSILQGLWEAMKHWKVDAIAGLIIVVVVTVWRVGLGALNGVFRPVRVNGSWITQIDRGSGWEEWEDATLHQFVNRVWGDATITSGKRRTYQLRGEIRGQMLCLIYRQTDRSGFDCGAIALEVRPDHREMDGYEVGYDKTQNNISPRLYKWTSK